MSSDQSYDDIDIFQFTEAAIIRESKANGWRNEGDRLSKSDLASLKSLIQHDILWSEHKLDMFLLQIFKTTFAEFKSQRMFEELTAHPARPKALRKSLESLKNQLESIEDKSLNFQKQELQDILIDLYREPAKQICIDFLDYVVFHFPNKSYPTSRTIRRGHLTTEQQVEFKNLIKHAIFIADQNIKRGGNGKPYHKEMVRRLAAIYQAATGTLPPRHYSRKINQDDLETGPLVKLSHQMARLIERNMPDHLRRPNLQFPGVCRDVSDEMRKAAQTE